MIPEYTNSRMIEAIDEYIHSERDRAIMKRRMIDGWTYEAIAEGFDLSVRNVKYIICKAQDKVFKHMT